MSVTWEFNGRILVITLVGHCSDELITAVDAALADTACKPGTSLLLDLRLCTDAPSSDDVRNRAQALGARRRKGLSRLCAVIVGPRPFDYGLARMAGVYFEMQGIQMEIFIQCDTAVEWLKVVGSTMAGEPTYPDRPANDY